MSKKKTIFILITLGFVFLLVFLYQPTKIDDGGVARERTSEIAIIEESEVPLAVEYTSDETKKLAFDSLGQLNAIRQSEGLKPLEWSDDLEKCASVRANEIVTKFSHSRPNNTEWYTVNENLMYAENLAKGYEDVNSCMNAWRKSPSHNANLMDSELRTVAVYITVSNGMYYWVQEFGY